MNCTGTVTIGDKHPVAGAEVVVLDGTRAVIQSARSDQNGRFAHADLPGGNYSLQCSLFGETQEKPLEIRRRDRNVDINFDLEVQLTVLSEDEDGNLRINAAGPIAGKRAILRIEFAGRRFVESYDWKLRPSVPFRELDNGREIELVVPVTLEPLSLSVELNQIEAVPGDAAKLIYQAKLPVRPAEIQWIAGSVDIKAPVRIEEPVGVRLLRTPSEPTLDQALWVAIRNRTQAMSFARYQEFMNRALCLEERSYEVPREINEPAVRERLERDLRDLGTNLHGMRAYRTLKLLTETFLLLECGVRIESLDGHHGGSLDPDEEGRQLGERFSNERIEHKLREYLGDCHELPYISRVVKAAFQPSECGGFYERLIGGRINQPCLLELWWSYCMEWGGLVQTMNAITLRFQNVRRGADRDPLANLSVDALRPLNSLLWGMVQDQPLQLSVRRRAFEYLHQYGLTLHGRATAAMNPADVRSNFLVAFHNLVYQATIFFKEDNNTTIISNGYPMLNCLKEVHLILAQGADNQFGDCAWESRAEMMLMQYLLARRETRDFLQCRVMVPYKEAWEGPVESMKALQGWSDASADHYVDLAVHGERILLACRYGDWTGINDEDPAKNFARYFKRDFNAYICAYRAIAGRDLTNPDAVNVPVAGVLPQNRWAPQRAR